MAAPVSEQRQICLGSQHRKKPVSLSPLCKMTVVLAVLRGARHQTHHHMLIQKIFHVRQDLDETKARLSNFHSYRRVFEGVNASLPPEDGIARFQFVTGNGFRADVELSEMGTEDSNQTLYQSTDGNMDVLALVEYFPIRKGLTEVHLTLEYTLRSHMHSVLDAVTASVDRFINRHLRRLQMHLSGSARAPQEPRYLAPGSFGREPQLAN